jgi:rSAM/selenodomain-associated transferase 2
MNDGEIVSIVIPVLNERAALPSLVERLKAFGADCEIIFADGGSTDGTLEHLAAVRSSGGIFGQNRFTVLSSPEKGRAAQMNFGAKKSRGNVLWFLHADSLPPADALRQIRAVLSEGFRAGCFPIRFDSRSPITTICGWLSNLRVRLRNIAFGDQGIFIEKPFFEALGGFAPIPLMEDYRLSQAIAAAGHKIGLAKSCIITSERRFIEGGRLLTMLKMQKLQHLYRKGVNPEAIAELYAAAGGKFQRAAGAAPRGQRLLFPGCHFPGIYPETTKYLIHRLRDSAGIETLAGCCGKPAEERGDESGASLAVNNLRGRLKSLGVTELVVLCPNCCSYLRERLGVKVTFIYQTLSELGMITPFDFSDGRMFIPCPDRPAKELLNSLSGCFSSPIATAEGIPCCRRCTGSELTGAGKLYAYCANCTRVASRLGANIPHILPLLLGTGEAPASVLRDMIHRLTFRYLFNRSKRHGKKPEEKRPRPAR